MKRISKKSLLAVLTIILTLCIGTCFSYADVGDYNKREVESNNKYTLADTIYNDYTVSGYLGSYDLDYFKFTLSSRSTISVVMVADKSTAVMSLRNSSDSNLKWTTGGSYRNGSYGTTLSYTLPAGTYYLMLMDSNEYNSYDQYMFYFSYTSASTHTHSYTYSTSRVDATCTANGYIKSYCSCGAYTTSTLYATGHTYVEDSVITEATCTTDGAVLMKCSKCNDSYQKTVDAAHKWNEEYTIEKEATEETAGLKSIHCSVCDAVKEGSVEEIPVLAHIHNMVKTDAVASTCTSKGNIEYYTCTKCKGIFSDAEGNTAISKEATITDYAEHKWNADYTVEKAPTCAETGYKSIHCSACDAAKDGSGVTMNLVAHNYVVKNIEKASTNDNGQIIKECAGCKGTISESIARPAEVVLTPSKYVYNGSAQKPSVTVKDINGNVIDSSNYSVSYATNCVNAGNHTVSVTFTGSNYTGTMSAAFAITSGTQTISAADKKLTIGGIASLDAKLTAGNGKLSYKSSNTKVATVSSTGSVTAKAVGTAVITITASGTNDFAQTTKDVKVTVGPKRTTLSSVVSNKNGQITVKWKKASSINGYQISYSTKSDMSAAKTVNVKGTKTLTKTITGLEKGKKYYIAVATYKTVGGENIVGELSKTKSVTAMNATLSSTSLTLKKGGTAKLTVKNAAGKKVKWSTSKKSVVKVSTSGKLTAKKLGTATITAKVGDQKLTCKVKVAEVPKISKTKASIYAGGSTTLKITGTSKKASWSSSNKSVATVTSKGVVKGKKAGTATITAKVAGKKVSCVVTVKNRVALSQKEINFSKPGSKTIDVTFVGNGTIRWDSSNSDVVTCSWSKKWNGNKTKLTVKGLKSGTATVKITNTLSSEVHKITVTVAQPWQNVQVVIPETIGEQDTPENRMKITSYQFYEGGSSYYSMKITFKCVQKGNGRSNWGEYFYCYDKNGNLLDECYLYAGSLAEGRTYNDSVNIPINTAKIVFEEYPEYVDDDDYDDEDWGDEDEGWDDEGDWDEDYDDDEGLTGYASEAAYLKSYITTYGSTNSDGDKFIKTTLTSSGTTVQAAVVFDKSTNKLRFINTASTTSTPTDAATVMEIGLTSIGTVKPEITVLYKTLPIAFSSYVYLSPSSYDTDRTYTFSVESSTGISNSNIQTLSNANLKMAFSSWEVLLNGKTGQSLYDFGFTNF